MMSRLEFSYLYLGLMVLAAGGLVVWFVVSIWDPIERQWAITGARSQSR